MDEAAEEMLEGGNLAEVVRIGDTVRRPAGPWTEMVHALLRHIRDRGFDLAPEPLGMDPKGREVLRFIEGSTVGRRHPWPEWCWSDDILRQAAVALRRYHDAVADFRPSQPIPSRLGTSSLGVGDVVCHNDFAPYNVVHRDGDLVGVVVLRTDLSELRDHLGAWTTWINEPDRFLEWTGDELEAGDDCLLARPYDGRTLSWSEFAAHPAAVELMLEQTDGDTWIYRRDPRVRDSLRRLGAPRGFLTPEVALLYKAPQHLVERNAADFIAVLPHLDPSRRAWLEQSLRLAHPGHPWLNDLLHGEPASAEARSHD